MTIYYGDGTTYSTDTTSTWKYRFETALEWPMDAVSVPSWPLSNPITKHWHRCPFCNMRQDVKKDGPDCKHCGGDVLGGEA